MYIKIMITYYSNQAVFSFICSRNTDWFRLKFSYQNTEKKRQLDPIIINLILPPSTRPYHHQLNPTPSTRPYHYQLDPTTSTRPYHHLLDPTIINSILPSSNQPSYHLLDPTTINTILLPSTQPYYHQLNATTINSILLSSTRSYHRQPEPISINLKENFNINMQERLGSLQTDGQWNSNQRSSTTFWLKKVKI